MELLKQLKVFQAHPITQKYWALGGASGWLGTNTTTILTCPDGIGKFQHYVNGSIYYHPSIGAHEVHGLIRARWQSMGWERSLLGYPKTDESACQTVLDDSITFKEGASIGVHHLELGKYMELLEASTLVLVGKEAF